MVLRTRRAGAGLVLEAAPNRGDFSLKEGSLPLLLSNAVREFPEVQRPGQAKTYPPCIPHPSLGC